MNIEPYLRLMAQKNASDLYFTTGAPPSIKIEGQLKPISNKPLEPGMAKAARDDVIAAYRCRGPVCEPPLTDPADHAQSRSQFAGSL